MQQGVRAVFPKGEAKEDWSILRALSEVMGRKLPYDSLDELRTKPWGASDGQVVDRYGVHWLIGYEQDDR